MGSRDWCVNLFLSTYFALLVTVPACISNLPAPLVYSPLLAIVPEFVKHGELLVSVALLMNVPMLSKSPATLQTPVAPIPSR